MKAKRLTTRQQHRSAEKSAAVAVQTGLEVMSVPTILRATFKKGETLRYTGHLDILRTFVRGLRRADIPIKYSEGFNPHAVMTFALPLGVGTTSECEIVDIAMKEEIAVGDFISRVNENMPKDGIEILSAEYTDAKAPEKKNAWLKANE